MLEFREWPKTPRLNREMILTEKIDGTNAAIIVLAQDPGIRYADGVYIDGPDGEACLGDESDGIGYAGVVVKDGFIVAAQSRKRIIAPGKSTDNAGFAAWVRENAQELAEALGEGYHYGEWWGKGIQHGYGQEGKRFSLFNVIRYAEVDSPLLDLVPVLYDGPFSQSAIEDTVDRLREEGSVAAPGQKAEGVVIFHKAAGHVYKVLCENDELPKGIIPWQEREATSV